MMWQQEMNEDARRERRRGRLEDGSDPGASRGNEEMTSGPSGQGSTVNTFE